MGVKNKPYLAFVRTLPCCNCGNPETEPHHIIGVGLGMMAGKASDIHTMPLCRKCHDEIHHLQGIANALDQIRWLVKTQDKALEEGEL